MEGTPGAPPLPRDETEDSDTSRREFVARKLDEFDPSDLVENIMQVAQGLLQVSPRSLPLWVFRLVFQQIGDDGGPSAETHLVDVGATELFEGAHHLVVEHVLAAFKEGIHAELRKRTTPECSNCGKKEGAMKRCSGCRQRYYCSARCQRGAWYDGHKTVCKFAGALDVGRRVVGMKRDDCYGRIGLVQGRAGGEGGAATWKVWFFQFFDDAPIKKEVVVDDVLVLVPPDNPEEAAADEERWTADPVL